MPAYVRRLSPLVKIQRAQVVKFKRAPTVDYLLEHAGLLAPADAMPLAA
jgi:hypothetical protein